MICLWKADFPEGSGRNLQPDPSSRDINTDSLYATILSDHGLSEGYEDGTFRPEKSLTRAELSTIVWRIDLLFG